jgi:hypothetical protein
MTNYNINRHINESVTLLMSMSCTVFDSYNNIPVTLTPEYIREILNMPSEEGIIQLSQHLCTQVIMVIYNDLESRRDWDKVRKLVSKSQMFHIHGRTARDILYPNSITDDPHAHHGRQVFVCTHC